MSLRGRQQGKMLAGCQRNSFQCVPANDVPSTEVQLTEVQFFLIIVFVELYTPSHHTEKFKDLFFENFSGRGAS